MLKRVIFFFESVIQFNYPRLLEFQSRENDRIIFKVLSTKEIIEVDADDRYGYYPKLTESKKEDMRRHMENIKAELETYQFLVDQFND